MIETDFPLSKVQSHLGGLYGAANESRSVEEILVRLDESAGFLGKALSDKTAWQPFLVNSFSWLVALANKLSLNLEESVLKKYPAACPYCLANVCECYTTGKLPVNGMHRDGELKGKFNTLKNGRFRDGATIPEIDRMLRGIYPSNSAIWKFNKYAVAIKLSEERAELVEAYRRHKTANVDSTKQALQDECADYLAWLLAVGRLLSIENQTGNLSELLREQYKYGCNYCLKSTCECSLEIRNGHRADPGRSIGDKYEKDDKQKLAALLSSLLAALESSPDLQSAAAEIKAITTAPATSAPSKSTVIDALTKAKSVVDSAESLGKSVNTSAGTFVKVGEKISQAIDWVSQYLP